MLENNHQDSRIEGFCKLKNPIGDSHTQGELQISSDGDDPRIFWVGNFQFRDFLVQKNLASIFFGWLDLSRDFLGYSKQSEDSWSCTRILAA